MTKPTKQKDIKRSWHLVDLKEKTLGRSSTSIAELLMGKSKPYFVRNLDCGDFVVAINVKDVKVTGKKELKKTYYRHSGFPGGFRSETLGELRARRPEEILRRAVKGMLPDNKLGAQMITRLYISAGNDHAYGDKFK